ncbi:Ribosomal protein L37/S30 family-containing protein [Aphelenchoides besseyi]|nr:Ribosomal protein L37/S30 family-containing protein [Aphelenchoides besseyi]
MSAKVISGRRAAQDLFSHRLRHDPHPSPTILNESFLSEGFHDGSLARLNDYHRMAGYVRDMPTVAERIRFVSPFERDWTRTERKWHRVQHRSLYSPRRAWGIPLTPTYFDCINFYKYITRMEEAVSNELSFNLPVKSFEKRLTESLLCSLDSQAKFTKEASDEFLRRILDDALNSLAHTNDFTDLRISHAPRCESFWICAGFEHLYRTYSMMSGKKGEYVNEGIRTHRRLIGDHRQKLGELAFTMRDEFIAQIRQRTPIQLRPDLNKLTFPKAWRKCESGEMASTEIDANLKRRRELSKQKKDYEEGKSKKKFTVKDQEELDDLPINFDMHREVFLHSPLTYNLIPDGEPLWQCPGYEPENGAETHPYGRLAIKNVFDLNKRVDYWGYDDLKEYNETLASSYRSTAITTLFNWLNAQAHSLGYTQYGYVENGEPSDFNEPFCSRLILSDGCRFLFATAELQTIAFNISVKGFNNERMNGIVYDGIYYLFNEFDSKQKTFKHYNIDGKLVEGLNPKVMERLLGGKKFKRANCRSLTTTVEFICRHTPQMSENFTHDDLLKTFLKLKSLGDDKFCSTHQLPGKKGGRRVYGGQVVGQALMAANATAPPGFHCHSLHCNFLAAADKDIPINYTVIRARDGRSFCSRLVQAHQKDSCVFTAQISFHVEEADSICHSPEMPKLTAPEECESSTAFFKRLIDNPDSVSEGGKKAAEAYRQILHLPEVFDVRIITPREFVHMPTNRPMKFALWVRCNAKMGDANFRVHHCIAAFISDCAPVGTPICANAAAGFQLGMAASLDHSMWIHRQSFRMDEDWLLYETESTVGAGGRALIHGRMWTRKGELVLSTAQEILVRGERK